MIEITPKIQKDIKLILEEYEDYRQGLAIYFQKQLDSKAVPTLEEFEQCVVDQNRQVDLLKNLIVILFDIKELDCAKDNYLTRLHKKYV